MAACDITKTVLRANQGVTVHFTLAPNAVAYKVYLTPEAGEITQFITTTTPYLIPPCGTGTYQVAVEGLDADDQVVAVGAEENVAVTVTAFGCGKILRQQLTDILGSSELQDCYVLRDDDGRYLNITESGSIATDRPVVSVGPAVFQASVVASSDRRIETWEQPIHIIVPGLKADVCLEQVGEIVSQVVRIIESVDYLALPGLGLSSHPWTWTADASLEDDSDSLLYTLLMNIEVQMSVP